MDILSYILSKKNSGSNPGGSGGSSSGSSASVEVAGGGTIVDPTQTYSRLYFNTSLSNEEVMALMNNLELTYVGMGNILYITITDSGEMDGILAAVMADTGTYGLMRMLTNEMLFAINGNVVDETITFTGWNPNIDFSNGIEISGETFGTELPMDGGPVPIGADNDKIADLFSSKSIKEAVNKGLSGVYDGNDLEVGNTHIDIASLLAENKLPLNINIVDDNLAPGNIIKDTTILGVTGTYPGIIPGGEIKITSTNPVDVTNYASAKVVDKNLVAANIARNKTILGVTGTYAGEGNSIEDSLITRTVASYSNDRVTSIGPGVFYQCPSLTSVDFPNATSVGDYALQACAKLTSINLPNITKIGNYTFSNCTSLTDINIPQLTSVGAYAFADCSKLTSVNLPKVTSIGSYAFKDCPKLTSIDFPQVTSIGSYAFSKCSNLASINFPLLTSIGANAFMDCPKLTSVDFPQITFLGDSALAHSSCTNINLPKVTSIGDYALYECTNLTSVDFPLLTYIGEKAFSDCTNLTDVNLPQLTSIGKYAFNQCKGLRSVDFPLVTTIKDSGFAGCTNLTSVNLPNVKTVSSAAFWGCSSLISVDLPLASVGGSVFSSCTNLISVNMPQSSYVMMGLFDRCRNLISVNISNAIQIDVGVFDYCYSLSKLFISRIDKLCTLASTRTFEDCYHILGTTDATYNPEGLKDGYIYVPASLLSQYKVATNWSIYASQIIGHEDLEAGATLPNYTTDKFTTQTWYSDEKLTTVVTEVATSGKYYCRLEA